MRAVRLLSVMLFAELNPVACQALRAIERNSFIRRDRAVRIMAAGARHRAARLFLAHALRQLFELAGGAHARLAVASEHVVANVVRQIIARAVLIHVFAGTLNRRIALEMALHANLVAALRRELRRIHDRSARQVAALPVRGNAHMSRRSKETTAKRIGSQCPQSEAGFR